MARMRYDAIGHGYSAHRAADPHVAQRIETALGEAVSVVNVGAGTGSYESPHRRVVAIEPSKVMIAQRGAGCAPAVRAVADALPLGDGCVDAAMALVTLHHWFGAQRAGVQEMKRVARGAVLVEAVAADLQSGRWDERYGHLRELSEFDAGPRLIAG